MKTIYDHDDTKSELDYLLIKDHEKEYIISTANQKKLSDLYCLFEIRNDLENMKKLEKSVKEGLY